MSISYYSHECLSPMPGIPAQMSLETIGMPEPSRLEFDEYIALREQAAEVVKPIGEELEAIQQNADAWLRDRTVELDRPGTANEYAEYDFLRVQARIGGLVGFLRTNYPGKISEVELEATEKFVTSTFSMYNASKRGEALNDRDGSFAFLVPMRMSRKHEQYGHEVEPIIPALRYVPNNLRSWMMRGLPPFIADTYQTDDQQRRGYLICVPPVCEDMKTDIGANSQSEVIKLSHTAVNDAVGFAKDRLGARVVGLGAILPSVTHYGDSVRKKFGDEIIVTTGHGGTVHLITTTMDRLREDAGEEGKSSRVGVLGLGAIGAAAAGIIAKTYPEGTTITVYDTSDKKMRVMAEGYPDTIQSAGSIKEVIAHSDVVVSAVTAVIDLEKEGVEDMRGVNVVDDSQPASFNPAQVTARGGRAAWVVGTDATGVVQRRGYDYGTMADGRTDLFGCEAEAASIAHHYADMIADGIDPGLAWDAAHNLAVTGPVTVRSASLIGQLFQMNGITSARPQAFGQHI